MRGNPQSRINYQGKLSKLLFYIEEDSYDSIMKFSTCIREFEMKAVTISGAEFDNIEKNIKELDSIWEKISDVLELIKIDLRYELGFE